MTKSLADVADELLTYMECSSVKNYFDRAPPWADREAINVRVLDGALPFVTDFVDAAGDRDESTPIFALKSNTKPAEVGWRLDLPLLMNSSAEQFAETKRSPKRDTLFVGQRYRSLYGVSRRQLELRKTWIRKQVLPNEFLMSAETMWFFADGTYSTGVAYTAFDESTNRFRMVRTLAELTDDRLVDSLTYEVCRQAPLILGVEWCRRRNWSVKLGYEGTMALTFQTSALGAREVFKLRDIPAGKKRRAALLHWVTQHWRASPSDAEEERLVREHLRGGTDFNWNGLTCHVAPSELDMEKVESLKDARARLKKQRRDRRRRVKN